MNTGSVVTNTTVTKGDKETEKMSIIYQIFYMMANMGGLYTMLMFLIGLAYRPVVNKLFSHDVINEAHLSNKKALSELNKRVIEYRLH